MNDSPSIIDSNHLDIDQVCTSCSSEMKFAHEPMAAPNYVVSGMAIKFAQ